MRQIAETYVEVAHPLEDGGVVLLGLAQQGGLLVLRLQPELVSINLWIMILCLMAIGYRYGVENRGKLARPGLNLQ